MSRPSFFEVKFKDCKRIGVYVPKWLAAKLKGERNQSATVTAALIAHFDKEKK